MFTSWRLALSRANNPKLRLLALTIYYLGIMLGLVLLYGRGDFSTPTFVYQGF